MILVSRIENGCDARFLVGESAKVRNCGNSFVIVLRGDIRLSTLHRSSNPFRFRSDCVLECFALIKMGIHPQSLFG